MHCAGSFMPCMMPTCVQGWGDMLHYEELAHILGPTVRAPLLLLHHQGRSRACGSQPGDPARVPRGKAFLHASSTTGAQPCHEQVKRDAHGRQDLLSQPGSRKSRSGFCVIAVGAGRSQRKGQRCCTGRRILHLRSGLAPAPHPATPTQPGAQELQSPSQGDCLSLRPGKSRTGSGELGAYHPLPLTPLSPGLFLLVP